MQLGISQIKNCGLMLFIAHSFIFSQSPQQDDGFFQSLTNKNTYDICATTPGISAKDGCFSSLGGRSTNSFVTEQVPINFDTWKDVPWQVVIEVS